MASVLDRLARSIEEERLVGTATVTRGEATGGKILIDPSGAVEGDLGLSEPLTGQVIARCRELMASRQTTSFVAASGSEEIEVFFELHEPPPRLVIVGAVHVAIPLVAIAKVLGFHTAVVDARSVYATRERFPHADELILRWPSEALEEMRLHESTYCVFLTHDAKLDNPALAVALRRPVRYVGALGSKRTHAKRVAALKEAGLSDAEIDRVHAPVGIPLGGNRPEEIALSIAAEMVAARHGLA
ncbi:MAG TPA: XdhC family protein [Thermoanaerobaculia bacterium]|nr:XdhC family protein [Thermoanaerobaculia bacterium]